MSDAPGCPCGHPHADPRDIDHRPSCRFYEAWPGSSEPVTRICVLDQHPRCTGPCGCYCHRPEDRMTPTGWDEFRARIEVKQIIDSYTLTMVGVDAEEYVEACADDVIKALLGWPVTYATGGGP